MPVTLKALKYGASAIFLPMAALAVYYGGLVVWLVPAIVFIGIPLIETWMPGSRENLSEEAEAKALASPTFDVLLYGLVLAHWTLLLWFLYQVAHVDYKIPELIGLTFTIGILTGTYGINIGHELGHRKTLHERLLAKLSLLSAMYLHFFIEHNKGHHANVATPDDPATAKRGEILYIFWLRSIIGSYFSAWRIENRRLRRKGKSPWSLRNQMIRFTIVTLALPTGLYVWLGSEATVVFGVTALIGVLLLETINYVEHYGLTRQQKDNGRYEKTQPHHSWNSNHSLGRILLFELTRHSDHHANSNRPYQVLRHFDEAPQLPTGYPGAILLAMVPPLWFASMHPRLDVATSLTNS